MKDKINELRVLLFTYSKYGGAWYYLKNELEKLGIPNEITEHLVICCKRNLGLNTANNAILHFDRIIDAFNNDNLEPLLLEVRLGAEWI